MLVLAGILQSLWHLGRVSTRSGFAKMPASTRHHISRSTNGLAGYPWFAEHTAMVHCRVGAAFLAGDFLVAAFACGARLSAASRPAARISSENSPLPAMRESTIVPIMVASIAAACLRAVLLDA